MQYTCKLKKRKEKKLFCLYYTPGEYKWFTEADVKHFKSGALRMTGCMIN